VGKWRQPWVQLSARRIAGNQPTAARTQVNGLPAAPTLPPESLAKSLKASPGGQMKPARNRSGCGFFDRQWSKGDTNFTKTLPNFTKFHFFTTDDPDERRAGDGAAKRRVQAARWGQYVLPASEPK
jgi:hypothetical protein